MGPELRTDFLFAQPSFLSGAARTLDLFGQFDVYNTSRTRADADAIAIAVDWLMVGKDFKAAILEIIDEDPRLAEILRCRHAKEKS